MKTGKLEGYISDARDEITEAFTERYSPEMTAASFALGAFIVLMPTSGTGLLIFAALALAFEQLNEVALFSTALVFNPAVKVVFYGLSYLAGSHMLGQTVSLASLNLSQLASFSTGMLAGSLAVATVTSIASYVAVYRLASVHG